MDSNKKRAASVRKALQAPRGQDEVCDLLCNVMHFCKLNSVDFGRALNSAAMHFQAEVEEEANPTGDPAAGPLNPHHYEQAPGFAAP